MFNIYNKSLSLQIVFILVIQRTFELIKRTFGELLCRLFEIRVVVFVVLVLVLEIRRVIPNK